VANKSYRYIGSHADQLAGGQPVAPGDYVELSEEDLKDPHNAMLLEDGKLIEGEQPKQPKGGGKA
jgi:hypothetical protein